MTKTTSNGATISLGLVEKCETQRMVTTLMHTRGGHHADTYNTYLLVLLLHIPLFLDLQLYSTAQLYRLLSTRYRDTNWRYMMDTHCISEVTLLRAENGDIIMLYIGNTRMRDTRDGKAIVGEIVGTALTQLACRVPLNRPIVNKTTRRIHRLHFFVGRNILYYDLRL